MIELLRYRDITRVAYYRDLLENAGIQTFIRNENLSTTEGVSIPDFYPALCILSEVDQERAMSLINGDIRQGKETVGELVCKSCGESSPSNFDSCWNCGMEISSPAATP